VSELQVFEMQINICLFEGLSFHRLTGGFATFDVSSYDAVVAVLVSSIEAAEQ